MNVIDALLEEADALMAELGVLFPGSASREEAVNWVEFLDDELLRTDPPEFLVPWFDRIPFPFDTELLELVGLRFSLHDISSPTRLQLFDYLDVGVHIDLAGNVSADYESATFDPNHPQDFVGVQALRWARWALRMVEWDETESVWWRPKGRLCARPGVYYGVEVPRQENEYCRFPPLARYASPLGLPERRRLTSLRPTLRIAHDICEGWLAAGCPIDES